MTDQNQAGQASQESKVVDLAIRLMFLGLFIYSAIVMVTPLASVFIWAVILCVAIYPIFNKLQALLGGRKSLAATLLVLIGLALTLGPIASAVSGFASLGAEFTEQLAAGKLNLPPPPEGLDDFPLAGPQIKEVWLLFNQNLDVAIVKYSKPILDITSALFGKALGIGLGLLGLALAAIIMGALLAPGPKLVVGVQKFANRIFAPRGGEFVLMAGATIQNVMKGVVGVAAIQAFVVWLLLKLFGIGSATTLAFISLILSIVQIGPGLVLIPVIIYAWSSMSGGMALAFTILAIPTMIMDSFLRPIFISQGLQTPMLVILIGVLGGVMAYGLIGIFMGPVLFAVFYELFTVWIEADPDGAEDAGDEGSNAGEAS
ncbi:putative inner membrane protein [Pseudoruegeria aquimaris]|uniref:Putative inner membrane protein n=1 Tax=Pseudoruegeria aquimaris TaxID=393663 RepID=A0A1Y5T0F6_9RHOB|nr:AI-2E family transporter [Pseudoruegeria aquimaris]SLN53360.1 putative inner membrane protein [Pseudoruegeria aquimaris]